MPGVKAQNQERRHSESNPLAEPIKIIFYSVLKILYTCISVIYNVALQKNPKKILTPLIYDVIVENALLWQDMPMFCPYPGRTGM